MVPARSAKLEEGKEGEGTGQERRLDHLMLEASDTNSKRQVFGTKLPC